ncbi:MAG: hypothetical protein AAFX06_09460 [Planctomycetota bacterium]
MNRSLPSVPPLELDDEPSMQMTEPRVIEAEQAPPQPETTDVAPPLTPIPREPEPQPETQPRLPNATDSIGGTQPMADPGTQPAITDPGSNVPTPEPMQPREIQPREIQPREVQSREMQPRETQPRETQPRTRPRESNPIDDIFNELPPTNPRPREPRPNTQPREGSIFDMLDDPFDGDSARLRKIPSVRPASHGFRSSQQRTYQPLYPRGRSSQMPSAQPIGTGLRPATTVDELRPVNHTEPVPAPNQKRVLAPYRKSRS